MWIAGKEYQNGQQFYKSRYWKIMRESVLRHDHYECQRCKAEGRYTRATTVHHVKHLKDRPDLALSMFDGDERQLVSLCESCHNKEHPEKMKYSKKPPLNEEKW